MQVLKKSLSILISAFLISAVWGAELEGKNLETLHMALDAKLYINNFSQLEDKLNYCQKIQDQIAESEDEVSEEVKFICNGIFLLERENAIFNEKKKNTPSNKKKKNKSMEKNEAAEEKILDYFDQYKNFAATHENLSSHFYFHYKEMEFATVPYLSTGDQLKIFMHTFDDYKKIEEQNPFLSENLFMQGAMLYFMPAIAGGSKTKAIEKLDSAYTTALCDYEKSSALVMKSQILFESKKLEESKDLLNSALEIAPENTTIKLLIDANQAGYSMFELEKYLENVEKN